jgi:hypothetical protein
MHSGGSTITIFFQKYLFIMGKILHVSRKFPARIFLLVSLFVKIVRKKLKILPTVC